MPRFTLVSSGSGFKAKTLSDMKKLSAMNMKRSR